MFGAAGFCPVGGCGFGAPGWPPGTGGLGAPVWPGPGGTGGFFGSGGIWDMGWFSNSVGVLVATTYNWLRLGSSNSRFMRSGIAASSGLNIMSMVMFSTSSAARPDKTRFTSL